MLPYITEVVHSYLPKWCTTICRSGAFLIAEFGALLFADHNAFQLLVPHILMQQYCQMEPFESFIN